MTSRYYRLPSLNALGTFEASARHRSLKRAAEELNVTPGAVSRQIRALEDELGVRLFRRDREGMAMTPEGEALYATLGGAFSNMASTIDRIRVDRREERVTLACSHAFAKSWLMPRMPDFWQRYPEVCVDHLISDDDHDFRRAEVDLRVRWGGGTWPEEMAEFLFGDTLYPVAGTLFAERHGQHDPADLASLPLLHVDWVHASWTGWDEFLRRLQLPNGRLRVRRFSSFDAAIQACESNQGVALGWHRLVVDQLAMGRLMRFTDHALEAPGAYYITWNSRHPARPAVRALHDWLKEMAAVGTTIAA